MRMRVGSIPPPLVVPEPPPEPLPPTLSGEPTRDTIAALHEVEDVGLRQAVATARQALARPSRRG